MIGIFGGTFDPVHYGHLRSVLEVKSIFGFPMMLNIPILKIMNTGTLYMNNKH